jgi:transcriptional regulator with XRE-family HTH domain
MDTTYSAAVAAEVRAEVARQQLGQQELAIRLGWSQPTLSRRLTGAAVFSTEEIEQLAEVLGVPVGQLASPPQREGGNGDA